MSTAASGRPVRRDPNGQLLLWRLFLAVFLTVATVFATNLDSDRVSAPGMIGSLGLLYTTIVASWTGQMAGVGQRLLVVLQLLADSLCIGLLVHFSGGPYSAFPLMFCLPIMLSAYFLGSRWSIIIAGVAAIFTGLGHFGLAIGWLLTGKQQTLDYLQGWPVLATGLNVIIFLVLGWISARLACRVAQRLQNQSNSALQVQKARVEVRNILDNIQSGLVTVNSLGVVTRVNPSCCRILNLPQAELMHRELTQVMTGGMEELAAAVIAVARGGTPIIRGEISVRCNGREKPLGMNVNHLLGPHKEIEGAIAIFTDLTKEFELSARMRESDRLAAIGELAASIAHEIRNPLASIRGSVEMLAGELDLAGYQQQLLDLVLKESARVNTIINDFLAYSRLRPPAPRAIFAGEFRDELTLQIRQHIAAKGGQVRVHCQIKPDNLRMVADPDQLTQMALNLAINACEAMNYSGELRLFLNQCSDHKWCELVVQDNGPGIAEEIRADLFAPFKTTKTNGTGLGLPIVARIVNAHGGSVQAANGRGGGAVFRVRLPLHRVVDAVVDDRDYSAAEEVRSSAASIPVGSVE